MKNITYRDIILAGTYVFFIILITSLSLIFDETYKPMYILITLFLSVIPTLIALLFMLPSYYGDAWFEEKPLNNLFY